MTDRNSGIKSIGEREPTDLQTRRPPSPALELADRARMAHRDSRPLLDLTVLVNCDEFHLGPGRTLAHADGA